ncbi:MAG: cobalamin biosynthesis protein CobD, partial [Deltaproteobacteria bacterium]|nr:cobalamin biosynthesis protein CobD [Deltaproteobacteria bacterium]
PEASVAGALGVKLGGPSTYSGVVSGKPFIGEDGSKELDPSTVEMAVKLMWTSGLIMVFFTFIARIAVMLVAR